MKPLKIDKELKLLFLATGFIKTYCDNAKKVDERIYPLYLALNRIIKLYSSRWKYIMLQSDKTLNKIEFEANKVINKPLKSRFEKRIKIDEDGHLVVHPLGIALSLILEHRNLNKTKLNPPYKQAKAIYDDLFLNNMDELKNSNIVASHFFDKIV